MTERNYKIIVLGASGMLGHTLFAYLFHNKCYDVVGTVRDRSKLSLFPSELRENIRAGIDAEQFETIEYLVEREQPDILINCVGIIKQLPQSHEPIPCISINALLPHRLAVLCRRTSGARLIHISTDCVFSGKQGNYHEGECADADDLYGRTKFLGEVTGPGCITLRTSIIGHELSSRYGLIEWFLSQEGTVTGYTKAIFSGLPTIELSRVITEQVIPHNELVGLYHVAAAPISKHDLLKLVAATYGKNIAIEPNAAMQIDRSLDGRAFSAVSGYDPPPWKQLIEIMHDDYTSAKYYSSRRERIGDAI